MGERRRGVGRVPSPAVAHAARSWAGTRDTGGGVEGRRPDPEDSGRGGGRRRQPSTPPLGGLATARSLRREAAGSSVDAGGLDPQVGPPPLARHQHSTMRRGDLVWAIGCASNPSPSVSILIPAARAARTRWFGRLWVLPRLVCGTTLTPIRFGVKSAAATRHRRCQPHRGCLVP